jgi:hypothetical protein
MKWDAIPWFAEEDILQCLQSNETFDSEGLEVLIMDNCTSHTRAKIEKLWAVHGIIVCPLPPHSASQIQPLDLPTFGVTRRFVANSPNGKR